MNWPKTVSLLDVKAELTKGTWKHLLLSNVPPSTIIHNHVILKRWTKNMRVFHVVCCNSVHLYECFKGITSLLLQVQQTRETTYWRGIPQATELCKVTAATLKLPSVFHRRLPGVTEPAATDHSRHVEAAGPKQEPQASCNPDHHGYPSPHHGSPLGMLNMPRSHFFIRLCNRNQTQNLYLFPSTTL